jgi:hypothetical protein
MVKRVLKWGGIFLGCMFVLGMVISIVDPEGTKARREERERNAGQAETTPAAKGGKSGVDPVFDHGFKVGFFLAKSGHKKPDAAEVDAMARKSALELGDSGGMGFKMQWKNGFWMGWNKGD